MIVITDIQNAIFDWAKQYSELADEKIIWSDQNIPQPRPPYITLDFLTPFNQIGQDYINYDETLEKHVIEGNRTFVVSLQVYGSDSGNIMLKLYRSLNLPEVTEYWASKNLSTVIIPLLSDTSFELDTLIEKRQSMEIEFYTKDSIESNISRIEHAQIGYDASGNTGQIIVN